MAELLMADRYANSGAPEHVQLRATLAALREVLAEQGLSPSPSAYFAAACAALEAEVQAQASPSTDGLSAQLQGIKVRGGVQGDKNKQGGGGVGGASGAGSGTPEVTAALLDVLNLALPRMPPAALRPRAVPVLLLLSSCAACYSPALDRTDKGKSREREGEAGEEAPPGTEGGAGEGRVARCALSGIEHVLTPSLARGLAWSPQLRIVLEAMLELSVDPRPKVRRKAQGVLGAVLSSLHGTACHEPASTALVEWSEQLMARAVAAEASEKGLQAGKGSARATAAAAVLHLLTALRSVLPLVAEAPLPRLLLRLTELLQLQHALVTQGVLHALRALICPAPPAAPPQLPAPLVADLVASLVRQEAAWQEQRTLQGRKADAGQHTLLLLQLLKGLLAALHGACSALCHARLPAVFLTLGDTLSSDSEEVVYHTGEFLRWLVLTCVDEPLVDSYLSEAKQGGASEKAAGLKAASRGPVHALRRVCSAVERLLGYQFQASWDHALRIAGPLFQKLGPASEALLPGVVATLGELQGLSEDDMPFRRQLNECLGCAVAAMGPAALLAQLPFNLGPGTSLTQARTWLFPLLKTYTVGAQLRYFATDLLPLAQSLQRRAKGAAAASRGGEQRSLEAVAAAVWELLPSFCHYASDTAPSFRLLAKPLAETAAADPVLRRPIVRALKVLVAQNREAAGMPGSARAALGLRMAAEGEAGRDEEGEGEGEGASDFGDDEGEGEGEGAGAGAEVEAVQGAALRRAKAALTPEVARENIQSIAVFAPRFFPILFEAHLSAPPNMRGDLQEAIGQLASITALTVLKPLFSSLMHKLLQTTVQHSQLASGAAPPPGAAPGAPERTPAALAALVQWRACLMDLALPLLDGPLDGDCFQVLYGATRPALHDKEAALQKRAYKLLWRMLACMPQEAASRQHEIVQELLASTGSSIPAAKNFRLRCIAAVLLNLLRQRQAPRPDSDASGAEDTGEEEGGGEEEANGPGGAEEGMGEEAEGGGGGAEETLAALLSEVMGAVKDSNRKGREAAYWALVAVARELQRADDQDHSWEAQSEDGAGPRLMRFFSMVLAGLAAASPHMISCAVTSLARLLFEFSSSLLHTVPQLMPSLLLLLRSRNREIIKAALGFLKVVAVRLPPVDLLPLLPDLVPGLLLWATDSKNHFKAKVRVIMERLVRRCGEAEVSPHVPEEHQKLIAHIRKARERKRRHKDTPRDKGTGEEEQDRLSQRSSASAARSWRHSEVFSEGASSMEESEGGMSSRGSGLRQGRASQGAQSTRSGLSSHARSSLASRAERRAKAKGMRLRADDAGAGPSGAPLDLLDLSSTRRALAPTALKRRREEGEGVQTTEDGRLLVRDEGADAEEKRHAQRVRHAAGEDEDEDRPGEQGAGGRGKRRWQGPEGQRKGKGSAAGYAGTEYAGRHGKGDVKKAGKMDPHAYWPLDARMLNRRRGKAAQAQKGMASTLGMGKKGRK